MKRHPDSLSDEELATSLVVEAPAPGVMPRRPHAYDRGWHKAFQVFKRASVWIGVRSGVASWHTEAQLEGALASAGFAGIDRRNFQRSFALRAQAR